MNPATLGTLIPIVALCIPIAAIITAGRTKRAQIAAQSQDNVDITRLEARIGQLEQQLATVGSNLLELEEKQSFLNRLLEDKS